MNSKLNVLVPAMLAALLAIPAGLAVAADEQAEHHPAGDAATPPADGMANMKKMQEQMAAIRASKNPAERARLMDEHMQSMQSTMRQMQQDKGCMMMGNGMPMQGGQGGGMNMMQMMMEQMMQHQKAMQDMGK